MMPRPAIARIEPQQSYTAEQQTGEETKYPIAVEPHERCHKPGGDQGATQHSAQDIDRDDAHSPT
jgi:hypothetical protein